MAFATIDVTKGITGTIPVANGGTGLASGTTGQFLKFTGSTTIATGEAGGGKLLQVVHATATTGQSSTSSSFVEYTGGNISITPSATSSKVLIQIAGTLMVGRNGQSRTHGNGKAAIYRGSTDLTIRQEVGQNYGSISNGDQWADHGITYSLIGLDSPNTTSATTYKLYFLSDSSLQAYTPMGQSIQFCAMEIGA